MQDLYSPSRVENAGEQQDKQSKIRKISDVPARYTSYPGFEDLVMCDPAHYGKAEPKTIREAMSAIEADLKGYVKGPVSRPEDSYIDFYDGDGNPFDVKTPLSPVKGEKWQFSAVQNAETILDQLDITHKNKITGEEQPVAVLLDTTYMSSEDRKSLWHELMKKTKEDRSVLKRIFEVNVQLDDAKKHNKLNENFVNKLLQGKSR